jgi:alpha-methylacyl-CoA racemase
VAALDGIRVLDLTRLLPGPLASLVLADLGAAVDKVEDPGAGDYLRFTPPQAYGTSVAFQALNRGKRSLILDLKHPEGVATLGRLVERYDIVFEQFRPGVLDRLGMGHQKMLERSPRLIVCALTGYGQHGPLRDRAGHDLNYLARAGLLGLMGPADGAPQPPSFQLADVGGGLWCVIGILAALRERDRSGRGSIVDIAMSESVIPFATSALSRLLGGEVPARGGEILTGGVAPYNTYRTKDGEFVSLGALEPKFLRAFCEGVGLEPDLSALMPGPHQTELKRAYAEVFAARTRAEWEAFAAERDCCLEPVLRPDELLTDAHLDARNAFFPADPVSERAAQFRTPVTPPDLVPGRSPTAGEHTDAILADSGFGEAEIAALRASGAVR